MNADETGTLITISSLPTRSSRLLNSVAKVLLVLLVLSVCLIGAVLVAPLQAQPPNLYEKVKMRDKLVQAPQWEAKSIKVYRDGNRPAVDAQAKEADYLLRAEPGSFRDTFHLHITAFIASESQHVWIGPTREVYIDTSSGVIGLRIGTGTIRWMESMIDPERHGKVPLDEAISEFHETVTMPKLNLANDHPSSNEWDRRHITHLEEAFNRGFFFLAVDQPQQITNVKITGVDVSGDALRLDLENPRVKRKGSVWLDLTTRKVTKAFEGDEQSFPAGPKKQTDEDLDLLEEDSDL
jgi:hypothetical protein